MKPNYKTKLRELVTQIIAEQNLLEYGNKRSPHSNIRNMYKQFRDGETVTGDPVFSFSGNDLMSSYENLQKNYDSLQKFVQETEEQTKKWLANATTVADRNWISTAEKNRYFVLETVDAAKKFMEAFNKKLDKLRPILEGTDHTKISNALIQLYSIYPGNVISNFGKIKRMKRMKYDSDFYRTAMLWGQSIQQIYDKLDEIGKMLGKTQKQVSGSKRRSATMKSKWGGY